MSREEFLSARNMSNRHDRETRTWVETNRALDDWLSGSVSRPSPSGRPSTASEAIEAERGYQMIDLAGEHLPRQ